MTHQQKDIPFIPKGLKSVDDQQPPFIPKGGWNPTFTEKDKMRCTEYYLVIKPKHGEIIAEMISQMIIYKKKYHLKYSEEQEQKIAAALLAR
jgi:hypothetical protein